jgi:RNA polymerase sigma-70 factor (ECF subfamily)
MNTTSITLLERLRRPAAQHDWLRFVQLYTPLLYFWACRLGLQEADAADLVQEVLTTVVQKLPEFAYDRDRSFRGWLRTVMINKRREMRRRDRLPLGPPDPVHLDSIADPDPAETLAEAEYRQMLVRRALEIMEAEFEPSTWKACWECVVAGRKPAEVARALGITTNAVYLAKSRVLRRLHQELDGMLD